MNTTKTAASDGHRADRARVAQPGVAMRKRKGMRNEYNKVCRAMRKLARKGGGKPLPQDDELYCRLAAVKKTLEWVYPRLIKTSAKGHARLNELMGHRHYAMGPTHAELYP